MKHDLGRDEERVDARAPEPGGDDERGDKPEAAREQAAHDRLWARDVSVSFDRRQENRGGVRRGASE